MFYKKKNHRTARFSLFCFPTLENHGPTEQSLLAELEGAAGPLPVSIN